VSLEEDAVSVYSIRYVEDLGQEHMHTTKILWEKIPRVSLHTERFFREFIYSISFLYEIANCLRQLRELKIRASSNGSLQKININIMYKGNIKYTKYINVSRRTHI